MCVLDPTARRAAAAQGGIGDARFLDVFSRTFCAARAAFDPSVIVLQCGVDGLARDPTHAFNLTAAAYAGVARIVTDGAAPVLLLGGGGCARRAGFGMGRAAWPCAYRVRLYSRVCMGGEAGTTALTLRARGRQCSRLCSAARCPMTSRSTRTFLRERARSAAHPDDDIGRSSLGWHRMTTRARARAPPQVRP